MLILLIIKMKPISEELYKKIIESGKDLKTSKLFLNI